MIRRLDDLGRLLELPVRAERIVCLVPSITETLFALGAGAQVAGVTDYCIHPSDGVRGKEKVGGTKNVAVERVLALHPDLVIANAEENRKHIVERLESAGARIFVTFPRTVDGCVKMISDVAALTGKEDQGGALIRAIEIARSEVRAHFTQRRPRVLCPIWKDPYMTVNRDTFVDNVIVESGGENVFAGHAERYPVFTLVEAAERRPEVIILPTEPYHFRDSDKEDFGALGATVPAVRGGRIYIVEGELLSWYGPRLPRALLTLSKLLAL
jgi:ABC-type Fe3+-hydroxamate transport system substrate-binding protein